LHLSLNPQLRLLPSPSLLSLLSCQNLSLSAHLNRCNDAMFSLPPLSSPLSSQHAPSTHIHSYYISTVSTITTHHHTGLHSPYQPASSIQTPQCRSLNPSNRTFAPRAIRPNTYTPVTGGRASAAEKPPLHRATVPPWESDRCVFRRGKLRVCSSHVVWHPSFSGPGWLAGSVGHCGRTTRLCLVCWYLWRM